VLRRVLSRGICQNQLNNYAYLPLNSLKKDAIIVIDKKIAEPVAILAIDPWKFKVAKKKSETTTDTQTLKN